MQHPSALGTTSDSRSLDQLKRLRLPSLAGKRFLDVGCKDGFLCGFASFEGAARVVGVDGSAELIGRARERFPDCEFLTSDGRSLPEGPFDVIVLAFALHRCEDQVGLLRALTDRLSDHGVLILELGIVSSPRAEWITVDRGIDQPQFPSMRMLEQVLASYAWKWMGPNAEQAGGKVKRHVIHVHRRRPVAYLMMEPPGYGKSTFARTLFAPANVPVVSGDRILMSLSKGQVDAEPALVDLVRAHFTPITIDETVAMISESGLLKHLVDVWCGQAGGRDFALDAFVPDAYHAAVESALSRAGYLPVRLDWSRPGPPPVPGAIADRRATEFFRSLTDGSGRDTDSRADLDGIVGVVDEVTCSHGILGLRGWAVTSLGAAPTSFRLRIDGREIELAEFELQHRPDVQAHLGLTHDLCGFRLDIPLPGIHAAPGGTGLGFSLHAVDAAGELSAPLPRPGEGGEA